MGKVQNRKGKFARAAANEDRSQYWKFGKSSGNPEATARRKARKTARKK